MANQIKLIGANGEFPNGQLRQVMRTSMENKNLLSENGALYVGTGNTQEVINTVTDANGNTVTQTWNIPITAALDPPEEAGYVLKSLGKNEQGVQQGIEWAPSTAKGFVWNIDGNMYVWEPVADSTLPGAYRASIRSEQHGLGATQNIMVQIMLYASGSTPQTWELVQSTVYIDSMGTITIYSNTRQATKVLLLAIGG